ncbi:MAG TPA: wax ester/triacylglycerol synthase family O-acyltransferase [Terriglobales bacterium]|nr:wax ester/triacylglycerol synthase family O-acyltransferase [Terriglobales bacterium]
MPDVNTPDCLSFGDTLFLHLERDSAPLHVASLCIFEGQISKDLCTRYVESKLRVIPRFRQRVVLPALGVGPATWQFADDFDVKEHVRGVRLKHGTERELKDAVSEILSRPLRRDKPLWEFAVISGLKEDRTAILIRVHHCLADGISGVGVMSALMEQNAHPQPLPKRSIKFAQPTQQPTPAQMLDGVVTSFFQSIERLLTVDAGLLDLGRSVTALAGSIASGTRSNGQTQQDQADVGRILTEVVSPTIRLPFNTMCRGPQRFRWAAIPFDDIRAMKRACGATVNDVVLALLTMTVARYSELKSVNTSERLARVVVPVNVRANGSEPGLGNQITFLPVSVPLGLSAKDAVAAVHARMCVLKQLHLAELVGLAGTLMGVMPLPAQEMMATFLRQWQISVCNFICTNVPGPQMPLYLHGHKLLACYPYVPIGGEMGMNCAVLTYDGVAHFGFTGDDKAIPDLDILPSLLIRSFEDMKREVLGSRSRRKPTTKVRVAKGSIPAVQVKQPQPAEKAMAASAAD